MSLCLPAGWVTANGDCALFEQIDINGILLGDCSNWTYVPADCVVDAAEGGISFDGLFVKFAEVSPVTSLVVQRSAAGFAYAAKWQATGENPGCTTDGSVLDYDTSSIGTLFVPPGVQYNILRVRGYGDIPTYGGTETQDTYGVFQISRYTTRNGDVVYDNVGGPLANVGRHLFRAYDDNTILPVVQNLMELAPAGGTLYFPAWNYVSDDTEKEDIGDLVGTDSVTVIKGLAPKTYTHKADDKTYYGFVSSNVDDVLPFVVDTRTVTVSPPVGEAPEVTKVITTIRTDDILAVVVSALKNIIGRVETLEAA